MSERATWTLLGIVAIGVTFGLLYLAGCFTTKLSASAAAKELRASTDAERVTCGGGHRGWDYTCKITYRDGHAISVDVKVNATSITHQSGP